VAALAATVLVIAGCSGPPPRPASRPTRPPTSARSGGSARSGDSVRSADPAVVAAVEQLLRKRSRAILHHDDRALLATIDPTQAAFRASQSRLLADLASVPLASWSYGLDPDPARSVPPRHRYGVPTWSPDDITLRYRLTSFDSRPSNLQQYPTFTRRDGRWFLASLTDFASEGHVSATGLWDYGPVTAVQLPGVLVLGATSELPTMRQVATEVQADIPRVSAVWGTGWSQRAVVLVPSTQRELGRIADDTGDLDQIAALTSAEVRETGPPAPVDDRVSINPATWPRLGPVGRRVVLTHELTHVATRADTGRDMPTWLVEGFADYVGFLGTGVATSVAAAELATDVRAGRVPSRLPADHDFVGSNRRLAQAYEGAWLACRYVAARGGQSALVRLYRRVGTSSSPGAVATALRSLLHLSSAQFTRDWRRYLVGQLA
jgi:hypothetical protein